MSINKIIQKSLYSCLLTFLFIFGILWNTLQVKLKYKFTNTSDGNRTKLILIWNKFFQSPSYGFEFGKQGFLTNNCSVSDCILTADREAFYDANAVVYHVFNFHQYDLPQRFSAQQIWVYANFENPLRSHHFLDNMADTFNLTFTYYKHPDTDVPISFAKHKRSEPFEFPDISKVRKKTKFAAWVVSDCNVHSTRNEYVRELSKYVPVDIYGDCGNLTCPRSPRRAKKECFKQIERDYFFYIAFENAYCTDYVTEKVLRAIGMDIVPIVLGRADYSTIFPEKSIINVADYESPKALAEYLQSLVQNITSYLEYLSWKKTYPYFYRLNTGKRSAFCRLCEILHDPSHVFKSKFNISQYWNPRTHCLVGDREREIVHL